MNKELQEKLYEKYPKIFRQKDESTKTSCMGWGICCGDGWVYTLCSTCRDEKTNEEERLGKINNL